MTKDISETFKLRPKGLKLKETKEIQNGQAQRFEKENGLR